jgi:hypothetical protein
LGDDEVRCVAGGDEAASCVTADGSHGRAALAAFVGESAAGGGDGRLKTWDLDECC